MAPYHVVFFLLQLLCCMAAGATVGSRRLDGDGATVDAAVTLDITSFNSTLLAASAPWAIVEFYAHWCPHCTIFEPQYEHVARLFNGPNAVDPDVLLLAKVDCALKVNSHLCDSFKIDHYPTLIWGLPSKLAEGIGDFEVIANSQNAESLLHYINRKMNKAYTFKNRGPPTVGHSRHEDELDAGQRSQLFNHDMEKATAEAMDIILSNKLLNLKNRSAFIQFLQLLVVHHPSKNCRKGIASLLQNMQDIWPSLPSQIDGDLSGAAMFNYAKAPNYNALKDYQICGNDVPHGEWVFCQGSLNDTRGYSCGLWVLFHAVSVRVEDRMASSSFRTICNFVANFFKCKDCQKHFADLCSSAKTKISSRRQLVLWLWTAHNYVNERVRREEITASVIDPNLGKSSWPLPHLCKSCWNNTSLDSAFNMAEVYSFLLKFYGYDLLVARVDALKTSHKERQGVLLDEDLEVTSGVPFAGGAAVALALASCSFGAVACVWRACQKRRKRHD